MRRELLKQRGSFVFETVFSDPVGDKLAFLEEATTSGYAVVLCFIGLATPEQSVERVAMRVSRGGHDVPSDKLHARYYRTLNNLRRAISRLPNVLVYDNSNLRDPYRQVAVFSRGHATFLHDDLPGWLRRAID